jgi:CO/xanthine dehydrogenase Mo-binding subunit
MTEYTVLKKGLNRVDGLHKVTGKAVYTADINLPNMLCGKILHSPHAHANIRRLDVSKARALDGVKAVITVDDVPIQQKNQELTMFLPTMAREKAIYAGQPVAAVAAIDEQTAEKALELIEVDYEVLTPVMDVFEAMKSDVPVIHPNRKPVSNVAIKPENGALPNNVASYMEYGRGDVEAGFKQADIVIENTFRTQRVHQGYIEPRASIASIGADGKITIWTDSQGIFQTREVCSAYLDLPLSKIKVMQVEVGGAFGGKGHQTVSPICALLSIKSGLPVKMVLTRQECFVDTYTASPTTITIKLGADKGGHIIAVSATVIYDTGAYPGLFPASMIGSMLALSPYRIPNISAKCYDIFTNKARWGFYRAPTVPQATFAVESQVDLLARALKIDPIDLRLKNAVSKGDVTPDGTVLPKVGFKKTLQEMKKYLSTRGKPKGENKGRGIACGYWNASGGNSSAHVNVNADGTVSVIVGSVDLTGSRTAIAQIAAEELGIPFENVTVVAGDTESAPHSDVSAGSKTTRVMGSAVREACRDAKAQLIQRAAVQLKEKPRDLEYVNGSVRVSAAKDKSVSLLELAAKSVFEVGKGPITGRGSVGIPPCPMFAVHMAEVEVDKETGNVRVLSYASAQDVGFAVNPSLIEGQVHGAVSQCVGWALTEDYAFKDGIMQNPTFLDYRMPTAVDLPSVDTLIIEEKSDAEYGMRGVGEPPITPGLAAIANAIHSAAGVRLKETPMNPEAIFWALQAQGKT